MVKDCVVLADCIKPNVELPELTLFGREVLRLLGADEGTKIEELTINSKEEVDAEVANRNLIVQEYVPEQAEVVGVDEVTHPAIPAQQEVQRQARLIEKGKARKVI